MRARSGISLLEIVIGLVVLVLALVPMFGLSIRNRTGIAVGLDEIEATSYATSVLEALQAQPLDRLRTTGTGDPGTRVEDLDPELASALRLPAFPPAFRLFVTIAPRSAVGTTGVPGAGSELAARLARAGALRRLEVVCRFDTRTMGEGISTARGREIRLVTLVGGEGNR